MAASVSLDLDPIFLKGLGYLHSKSKDSADKLRALLDESLSGRGSDSSYRSTQKEVEVTKVSSVSKISLSKQDSKSSSSSSSSSSSKSSSSEKNKKEVEKRSSEKVRAEPGEGPEPLKKPRLEPKQQENRSSPVTVQPFRDIPLPDFSSFDAETNADDFAMEMGLACVVCRQMTVTSGNQLVECQECHNLYHQDCHKPQVTDKDVNDPRLVWYCARCTRQMKRMAQKTQKPPQKPAPAVVCAAPVMKDPLVKKPELKVKPDTATTFQAFKRTEVKTSAAVLANPSASGTSLQSGSGLTGWAAFGAKTSTAGPGAGAKPGSSGPSGGSKGSPATTPPAQKPAGLLGLTGSKSGGGPVGGGTKAPGGNGGNGGNSSGSSSLKPPPPLTLGKQTLIRSSSGENQGRGTSPGSSPSGSQPGLGGNGGGPAGNGGGNGNGSKGASATSQESQLNAMKRLQMVKKKAAQKKLKK
ncbi:integrator complex subunit 12 [Esox lucius]|nr:integrator complex subunit 12 [Esox lucius]XP_010886820.1 integrator complex subunit 12 [Esox lucius]XP_034146983.1 integrator complex subunit 12 [Esox lucius]